MLNKIFLPQTGAVSVINFPNPGVFLEILFANFKVPTLPKYTNIIEKID